MSTLIPRNTHTTWIWQEKLPHFLDRVSNLIRFRFQEWDWDAIRFGIRDSDAAQNQWYEYELTGTPPVNLAFARAENAKHLCIRIETDAIMIARIDTLARILQCDDDNGSTQDLENLVRAAFIDLPAPDQSKIVGCDAAHLAICSECQDTLKFFTGKHWMDLLEHEAWASYGDANFWMLETGAAHFFFPANLIIALRNKDGDMLEEALRRIEAKQLRSIEKQSWTPSQQELIQYALFLLGSDVVLAC